MKKFSLFIPWLLVCIGVVTSLFFSEVTHKEPCTLCWYQRVVLFPLPVILGIAAFRNAYRIILYVLPLTLIGLAVSLYQVILIQFFSSSNICPACTLRSVSENPITFPLLALGAFVILNSLLIWIYLKHKNSKKL